MGPDLSPDSLMRVLVKKIISYKDKNPFARYLALRENELAELIAGLPDAIRGNSDREKKENIRRLCQGSDQEGIEALSGIFEWMCNRYLALSPEVDAATLGISYEEDDPNQKLRYFAAHAEKVL